MALAWTSISGCASEPPTREFSGYPVVELSRRELFSEGRLIGYLRELEIQQPTASIRFFRVENPSSGWVGNIDSFGRFFKRVLFKEDLVAIGMFPMHKGLGRLFDLDSPIRIVAPSVQTGDQAGTPVEAAGGKPNRTGRRDGD